ncbi:hypothetical protein EDEG_02859 [Edhazardia aedis USNM 41457]|uniref:J domain-containing protein n=1 Tax=Edhazardia aedis (strain USNM 41457) TaxID=1003232 RepID=J8ZSU8_EDHAE|nr:hypothetical protein EDEG_02859 [Edhazardia aedis USNM 41457]|eukprot:EJW02738.1 hypothetical protein EDEG_02859 [Edhazardia aedis USNM 41457]
MGNSFSKLNNAPETPYEIMGLKPGCTESEIKRKFAILMLKYHPDKTKQDTNEITAKIINAYNVLIENIHNPAKIPAKQPVIIDFGYYDAKILRNLGTKDFYKKINDVVQIIIDNESIYDPRVVMPKFGDENTKNVDKFYEYYKTFKTRIDFTKLVDKSSGRYWVLKDAAAKRNEYNIGVRNMCRLLTKFDPRIKKNLKAPVFVPLIIEKPVKTKIRKKKDAEQYAFYCDACGKGYNSKNTVITHVKSSKHKQKCLKKNLEDLDIEEILKHWDDNKEKNSDDEFDWLEKGKPADNSLESDENLEEELASFTNEQKNGMEFDQNENFDLEPNKSTSGHISDIFDKKENNVFDEARDYTVNCEKDKSIIEDSNIDYDKIIEDVMKSQKTAEILEEARKLNKKKQEEKLYVDKIILNTNNSQSNIQEDDLSLNRSENNVSSTKKNHSEMIEKLEKISLTKNSELKIEQINKETENTQHHKTTSFDQKITFDSTNNKKSSNNNLKGKKNKKVFKKKVEITGNEPAQLLKCSYCKQKFDTRNKLFLHLREVHFKNDK